MTVDVTAKPTNLSTEYWTSLKPEHRALYARVRPMVDASYQVDVSLVHMESFLEGQRDDMKSLGGVLDLEPDYQRGHVWTLEQRVRYVESLIRGQAPNTLMFNCPGWGRSEATGDIPRYTFQCIDGLQRMTTVRMFMRGEFTVFDGLTAADLRYSPFDPLRVRMQVRVYEFTTRAELLQFYLDLNSAGTVHPPEELARVSALRDAAK
jgi:Protein of unknown function DUF262